MSAEAKVGMFFLIALLLVGVIALYLGDFWVRARSYPVTAYFENVQGLPGGAEVRFAGVKVGRVTAVELEDNPKFPGRPAAVKMAIFHDAKLYEGDEFVIQQSAILGDKYVEVRRTSTKPKTLLASGAQVEGGQSVGIEGLTEEARALVKEARNTLASVRGVFASEQNQLAVEQILANVAAATGKANAVATRALQMAAVMADNASKAGPDVAAMANNLREASLSVKNTAQLVRSLLATSPVPRDMGIASGNIRKATEDMATISGNLAGVLGDPGTRMKVEQAIGNLHRATEHLATVTGQAAGLFGDGAAGTDIKEALARLREAATSIAKITSTYEQVLTDPSFTTDVRQTMAAARQATETGARAMQKAERSLEKVDQTMEKVTAVTQIVRPVDTRAAASLEGSRDGGLRADLRLDLQYGQNRDSFWRLGMRDFGDRETFVLQRAFPLGHNRARAGVYGNKIGVGYDVNPHGRMALEADVWNPNEPRLDLRGVYGLGPRTDLLFGFNKVADETDPFVGLRYSTER